MINPTKERGPKTLYSFNNRIIIYLYKIINFIKKTSDLCFFIPKHRIYRHSVHLQARVVISCKAVTAISIRAINDRAINRRAINDYMERLHNMMKHGNFIEVYNNNCICLFCLIPRHVPFTNSRLQPLAA